MQECCILLKRTYAHCPTLNVLLHPLYLYQAQFKGAIWDSVRRGL